MLILSQGCSTPLIVCSQKGTRGLNASPPDAESQLSYWIFQMSWHYSVQMSMEMHTCRSNSYKGVSPSPPPPFSGGMSINMGGGQRGASKICRGKNVLFLGWNCQIWANFNTFEIILGAIGGGEQDKKYFGGKCHLVAPPLPPLFGYINLQVNNYNSNKSYPSLAHRIFIWNLF